MYRVAAVAVSLALALSLWAAPALAEQPLVALEALPARQAYAPGKDQVMGLALAITRPYHINAHKPADPDLIATGVVIKAPKGFSFGPPGYPKAEMVKLKFSSKPVAVYHGRIVIRLPFRAAPGLAPGQYRAEALLTFQACDDQSCMLPDEARLKFSITLAAQDGPPLNQKLLPR